jgi:hypothetical protein
MAAPTVSVLVLSLRWSGALLILFVLIFLPRRQKWQNF